MDTNFAGLFRALGLTADELAAEKGEDHALVQIKRNSERLEKCETHVFEPAPNWRATPMFGQKIKCTRCNGVMKTHDAMTYLRGYAHGSGADYEAMTNAIWPPGDPR